MTRQDTVKSGWPNAPVLLSLFLGGIAIQSILASPSFANNYGESFGWQFKTSADRANQAFVLDLLEKRRGGAYRAPNYTTTIQRQYNCGVSASAVGNEGSQGATANSPSVVGPNAIATGNDADTTLNGGGKSAGDHAQSWQSNGGAVSSGVNGSASSSVSGSPTQALNSTQTNSGAQHASVSGANGCSFGGAQ